MLDGRLVTLISVNPKISADYFRNFNMILISIILRNLKVFNLRVLNIAILRVLFSLLVMSVDAAEKRTIAAFRNWNKINQIIKFCFLSREIKFAWNLKITAIRKIK